MMWERNTAVRYFITTRAEKDSKDYIGLMTAEDTWEANCYYFRGIKIL
jgi:hypothetical protein